MAGNLPQSGAEQFKRNDDHVSVLSGTLTGAVNSLVSLVPSAISPGISAYRLMDIAEMPQEDYSADGEVEWFAEKYQSGSIDLKMQDLATYHTGTGSVFECFDGSVLQHEIIALALPMGGKQPCSA